MCTIKNKLTPSLWAFGTQFYPSLEYWYPCPTPVVSYFEYQLMNYIYMGYKDERKTN